MEQKPHKKDELLVANNVLKLAAELLKVKKILEEKINNDMNKM